MTEEHQSTQLPDRDPLDDPSRHGAADPPRDPLADAARRLVVDDVDARLRGSDIADASERAPENLPDAEPG